MQRAVFALAKQRCNLATAIRARPAVNRSSADPRARATAQQNLKMAEILLSDHDDKPSKKVETWHARKVRKDDLTQVREEKSVGRKASANAWTSLVLAIGVGFIAAGASVPSEETMALGFFVLLAAISVLLGLNWPTQKTPVPSNLISLSLARTQRRQRV